MEPLAAQRAGEISLACPVTLHCVLGCNSSQAPGLCKGSSLYSAENDSFGVLVTAGAPDPSCLCSQKGDNDAEVAEWSVCPSLFPEHFSLGSFSPPPSSSLWPQEGQPHLLSLSLSVMQSCDCCCPNSLSPAAARPSLLHSVARPQEKRQHTLGRCSFEFTVGALSTARFKQEQGYLLKEVGSVVAQPLFVPSGALSAPARVI